MADSRNQKYLNRKTNPGMPTARTILAHRLTLKGNQESHSSRRGKNSCNVAKRSQRTKTRAYCGAERGNLATTLGAPFAKRVRAWGGRVRPFHDTRGGEGGESRKNKLHSSAQPERLVRQTACGGKRNHGKRKVSRTKGKREPGKEGTLSQQEEEKRKMWGRRGSALYRGAWRGFGTKVRGVGAKCSGQFSQEGARKKEEGFRWPPHPLKYTAHCTEGEEPERKNSRKNF